MGFNSAFKGLSTSIVCVTRHCTAQTMESGSHYSPSYSKSISPSMETI